MLVHSSLLLAVIVVGSDHQLPRVSIPAVVMKAPPPATSIIDAPKGKGLPMMLAPVTNLPTITPVNISGQRVFAFQNMFKMYAYIKMKTLNSIKPFQVCNGKCDD